MFINNFINQYGSTILYTILTTIISYLGLMLKKIIKTSYDNKIRKEVVEIVCKAVEQLYSDLSGEEKLNKAMESANEMLNEKGILTTDLELRMLIEWAVHSFKNNKYN
jgi:hypothetical protein